MTIAGSAPLRETPKEPPPVWSLTEAQRHGGQVIHPVAACECGEGSGWETYSVPKPSFPSLPFSSLPISAPLSLNRSRASDIGFPLISVPLCLRERIKNHPREARGCSVTLVRLTPRMSLTEARRHGGQAARSCAPRDQGRFGLACSRSFRSFPLPHAPSSGRPLRRNPHCAHAYSSVGSKSRARLTSVILSGVGGEGVGGVGVGSLTRAPPSPLAARGSPARRPRGSSGRSCRASHRAGSHACSSGRCGPGRRSTRP